MSSERELGCRGEDPDVGIFPSAQINRLVGIATQTLRFDVNSKDGGIGKKAPGIEEAEQTAALEVRREHVHDLASLGGARRRSECDGIRLHTRAGHVDGGALRERRGADEQRENEQPFHGLKLISTPSLRTTLASSAGGAGKCVRCSARTSAWSMKVFPDGFVITCFTMDPSRPM